MSPVAHEDQISAEGRVQETMHAEPLPPSMARGLPDPSMPGARVPTVPPNQRSRRSAPGSMPADLRQGIYGTNGCLAAILADETNLVLHVSGTCMEPLLLDRERVSVTRLAWPCPGDVVAVLRSDGTALMHRFLGYVWWRGRWKLMTMADSAARPDALADRTQLLGKVIAREGALHSVSPRLRVRAFAAWIHWTLRLGLRRLGFWR